MAVSLAHVGRATEIRPWVAPMVRLGYAAKGVIYLLMGTFAVQLAIGEGGRLTDSSGVLHAIVRQPFGSSVLTMIGVGILAYAAWHVAEAVLDMGFALVRAALDRTPSKAAGTAESLWTLFAQPYPYGTLLLAAVAAGLVCYGLFQLLHARYARL